MKDRVVLIIAAAGLIIGGSAACSSEASANQGPATLPPGTAQLTIDGKELPTVRSGALRATGEILDHDHYW